MTESERPLKVFLCHTIPLWDAHADRDAVKPGIYPAVCRTGWTL